jgi:signal transduction histidine kinase/CheY-like chemotaxis protein
MPLDKLHPLLKKQMAKFLPQQDGVDSQFEKLLHQISMTYTSFEEEKNLSDHAFMLSEKEYQTINQQLATESNIRIESIKKLKTTVQSLLMDDSIIQADSSDLIDVVNTLQVLVKERKAFEEELIAKREDALVAAKSKSDFLAVMSHEIRTPLNAIVGISNLLARNEKLPAQKENIDGLLLSADHLMLLLNDVLDFSKLDDDSVELRNMPFDLQVLVNDVVRTFDYVVKEKQNRVEVEFIDITQSLLIGEAVRLRQVIKNIFSNANKFTKNGLLKIIIRQEKWNADEVKVYFAITDSGIGIANDKLTSIFEKFVQTNSGLDNEYGGTGLGLTISRKIVELLGGEIKVQSELGKGSVFSFDLVFKTNQQIKKEDKALFEANELNNKTVLLVEDAKLNVLVATQFLKSWGMIVTVVGNGEEALQIVKVKSFDVILMDIHMPVMDGLTSAKNIRLFNTQTPIIALSASSTMDIKAAAKENGMNDFISKPFIPNEMYATILNQLTKA